MVPCPMYARTSVSIDVNVVVYKHEAELSTGGKLFLSVLAFSRGCLCLGIKTRLSSGL